VYSLVNPASKSVENIKRAALDAVRTSMPTGVYFGTVISITPLKVTVEPKIMLTGKQLVLTSLVKDFSVDMTFDHSTEQSSGELSNEAKEQFTVHLGLKVGERVILIREQGGQRFVVLDRVR
jgi:hypothetical protein